MPPNTTDRTGYAYISNVMQPYSVQEVNARKIYELSENLYITGIIRQMLNLILPSTVTISVYDEKDEVVENLSRKLNRMFSQESCSIKSTARTGLYDLITWGISLFNWVWKKTGTEIVCTELNHLHPYTFRDAPLSLNFDEIVYGRLLHGIYYSLKDRSMHYCQVQRMSVAELSPDNLFVMKDAAANYPDGESLILPIAVLTDFLEYTWNALGQQMYRTGAPIMFITVKDPKPERMMYGEKIKGDIDYAKEILASWGKDTPFTLRENMTVSTVDVKEGSLAIETINKAGETIRDYISPVGMLGRDGSLIGGNTDSSLKLVNNNIRGWVSLLQENLRRLPNYYLQANHYPETWHAEVHIETSMVEDIASNREKAKMIFDTKCGTVNEVRELLGLEGVSKEEMKEMMEEWKLGDTN